MVREPNSPFRISVFPHSQEVTGRRFQPRQVLKRFSQDYLGMQVGLNGDFAKKGRIVCFFLRKIAV